ncbi:MAG: hypothetical protein AB1810_00730 [Pseudomonadota bacterium]
MNKITTIGLDFGKTRISRGVFNQQGKVIMKRTLKRHQVLSIFCPTG